jgi:hypothetical protein
MTNINRRLFNLTINHSKSFTLTLFGFSITNSFFVNIFAKVYLEFVMITGMLFILPLVIKKIKFTFNNSLIKLYWKFTLSLNLRKVILTISSMKLTTKWIQSISAKKIILNTILKMRLRIIGTSIKIKKIAFDLNVLVGTFVKLSVYDPQMLSVLDTKTLQEMDIIFS